MSRPIIAADGGGDSERREKVFTTAVRPSESGRAGGLLAAARMKCDDFLAALAIASTVSGL